LSCPEIKGCYPQSPFCLSHESSSMWDGKFPFVLLWIRKGKVWDEISDNGKKLEERQGRDIKASATLKNGIQNRKTYPGMPPSCPPLLLSLDLNVAFSFVIGMMKVMIGRRRRRRAFLSKRNFLPRLGNRVKKMSDGRLIWEKEIPMNEIGESGLLSPLHFLLFTGSPTPTPRRCWNPIKSLQIRPSATHKTLGRGRKEGISKKTLKNPVSCLYLFFSLLEINGHLCSRWRFYF